MYACVVNDPFNRYVPSFNRASEATLCLKLPVGSFWCIQAVKALARLDRGLYDQVNANSSIVKHLPKFSIIFSCI